MSEQSAVESKIRGIIVKQLGVDEAEVIADKSFIDDLGADSLDIVELMMAMEDEFGFEIPEEQAQNIRTVGDAVSFISSQS